MAKNSIRDYDATSGNNTDVQSVDISEGCAASGINNALREIMTDLKQVSTGAVALETPAADQLNVDNIRIDGNTISSTDTNGDITLDPNGTGDTIIASGNVGIATASPESPLHVIGDGKFKSSGEVKIRFQNDTTGTGSSDGSFVGLFNGSDGMAFYNYEATPMRFFTSNAERMRIDSSGNLLVGKTANNSTDVGANIRADKSFFTSNGQEALVLNRNTSDGTILELRKANGTVGSIGSHNGGGIYVADNNVGFRFDDNGTDNILPCNGAGATADNSIDLGVASARFDDIFATNTSIQTSDQNEKQQIASLTTAEITAAKALSKLFKTFKWNSAVAAKGDAARTHTGHIAQEVQTAMTDAGLDASNYAFWCSNTWWETSTDVAAVEADEEAGIEAQDAYTRIDTYHTADEAPEGATQRTRLGIRYPELLAFVGAATEQRLADIETRLTALENA